MLAREHRGACSKTVRGLPDLRDPANFSQHQVLEILEDRYGRKSTVVTSQLPVSSWHHAIADATYADLSLFQVVEGLRYAFPRAMARQEKHWPRLIALHDRIAERSRIVAYLKSPRRLPFSVEGVFRHYGELDG